VITFVVGLTLLGAGDPRGLEGIDSLQKSDGSPVTQGIPRTKNLGERIDFFEN
jgi:hypothetical protein